jgi:simple sugar transport system permease protein
VKLKLETVHPGPSVRRFSLVLCPALALLATLLIAALVLAAMGKDPVQVLRLFLIEPLKDRRAVGEVLLKATPLMLCGLGLALCFRSNVWNIGAEGQFLLGAITAGGFAMWASQNFSGLSPWLAVPAGVVAGMLGGAVWASLTAFLKDRCHANEILVSLMLVYVANLLLSYLVFGPWKDPQGWNFPQTIRFADFTAIPRIGTGMRLHWGFVFALLLAPVMSILMFRTHLGARLRIGGLAPAAARFAGFSPREALWTTLLLSGAFAGMAGAMEVLGPMGQLTPHVSTGYGFTAIIVAFVGRLHPLGCVLASVLLSMWMIGGELSQSRVGLPAAVSSMFQGVLLLMLLGFDALSNTRVVLTRAVGGGSPQASGPSSNERASVASALTESGGPSPSGGLPSPAGTAKP